MVGHILLHRHYKPQPPPIRQHHIPIPLVALPTLQFFPASLPQLTFLQKFYSGTTNLHRHHYANTVFGFPSSRYLPHDFFLPLYLHFNKFKCDSFNSRSSSKVMRKDQIRGQGQRSRSNTNDASLELTSCILSP